MASTTSASSSLFHHFISHHHQHHRIHLLTTPLTPTTTTTLRTLTTIPTSLSPPLLLRPSFHLHLRAAASTFPSSSSEEEYDDDDEPLFPAPRDAGRLYVGNLPFSMTPAQLQEVFSQAGPVENVEVVYDRVTDRSRGFAFVTMAGHDEAAEAIRMFNGAQVGGRTVKVNFPEVPRGGERAVMGPRIRNSVRDFVDSPYKVYAGNLGWSVTSESLKKAFEGLPGLLGARVIYDRETGRSRGYGFVSFASPEDASSAIDSMNTVEVEGRPLRLGLAAERETVSATASSASE